METNDDSLYGHPAELRHAPCLVGEAKAREEEHSLAVRTRGLKRLRSLRKTNRTELRFRAQLPSVGLKGEIV